MNAPIPAIVSPDPPREEQTAEDCSSSDVELPNTDGANAAPLLATTASMKAPMSAIATGSTSPSLFALSSVAVDQGETTASFPAPLPPPTHLFFSLICFRAMASMNAPTPAAVARSMEGPTDEEAPPADEESYEW